MQRNSRLLSMALGVFATTMMSASSIAAQESAGTIAGRVIDRGTTQPISEAQVQIAASVRGARTTETGEYRLTGVPAGTYTLRVVRIGYSQETRSITVVAGQTVTADFQLSAAAVQIDQVVVTATGETQRRRESGATTTTIATENLPLPAVNSFSNALSSRAAGLTVINAGGTTGTNSRIRIRGSNSINLSNDPLIIIDGVLVSNNSDNFGVGLGGQTTSRFDDINNEDIENIEVIKGPAGTALYGSAAANGVIQITTKRGRAGKTRWNTYAEYGNIKDYTDYPSNYLQVGRTPANAITTCNLDSRGRGLCTPIADSLLSWNPIENVSPLRTGWREQYGLNASGGVNEATYYLGGEYEREQGIYEPNRLRRINFRTNVRAQLKSNLDAAITIGYTRSKSNLPFNDNTTFGAISTGLLGKAYDCSLTTFRTNTRCGADSLSRGYFTANVQSTDFFAVANQQDISRIVIGGNVNYQPTSWLRGVGRAGADIISRYDQQLIPPNKVAFSTASLEGSRFNNRTETPTFSSNGTMTASFNLLGGALTTQTSVGAQIVNEINRTTTATGAVLTPGTGSLNGTSARFAVGEANSQVITVGGYAEEKLAWRDRLFLTGSVRADDNSNFGAKLGLIYYPSVSASWVLSEEAWFPKADWLSQFRIRSAYGKAGNRPGFRQANTFFSPVSVRLNGADLPAVTVGGAGNADLNPEISEELEGGFELSAFSGKLGMSATYFTKTTNDALVSRVLAPSLGNANSRFVNFAEVRNSGIEADFTVVPLEVRNLRYELQGTYTQLQNQLMDLGTGISPIIFGFNSSQRHTKGSPLGAFYLRNYTFADKDGNNTITRVNCPTIGGIANPQVAGGPQCEVTLSDTAVYLGQPLPPREINLNQTLTLFRNFQVTALLNHRGGHKLFNSTREFRCSQFRNCQDIMDPSASLEDQAKVIGSLMGTVRGYVEDASFTRLREVSATYNAPVQWAQRLGLSTLGLTFAGRNLAIWTDYTGFDPEVNSNATALFSSADFLAQPPVRYFVLRLNANF
ncbi:MAG: SusC/RagA family TonB-linked outer membrane protein [Cytophagaceae bacterium]|nr:SusC/RagA family TonB-linked outer membrane protein [Gemmatimonadaceae bacterium]